MNEGNTSSRQDDASVRLFVSHVASFLFALDAFAAIKIKQLHCSLYYKGSPKSKPVHDSSTFARIIMAFFNHQKSPTVNAAELFVNVRRLSRKRALSGLTGCARGSNTLILTNGARGWAD